MWGIEEFMTSVEDRRSIEMQLLGRSTNFMVGVIASYLFLVLWLGPRFMEKRRPYSLKRVIVAYNILQVLANSYFFFKVLRMFLWEESSFWCQPMMYNRMDERGMEIMEIAHFFYMIKIFDLLDTIFFVLRKKNNQVSFLHVSHHASVVFYLWLAVRVYPGGISMWASWSNSFVHSIMYSYYLLAAIHFPGLSVIKPFITMLQMVQFVGNSILMIVNIGFCTCERPIFYQTSIVGMNIFFLYQFFDFFRKAYRHPGHQGFARKAM